MQWLPPFGDKDVKVVYETPNRISGLLYSEDCQTLFMAQTVNTERQLVAIDLKDPKTTYVIQKGADVGGGGEGGRGGGGGGGDGAGDEVLDPSAPDGNRVDQGYDHGNDDEQQRGQQPGER